MTTTTTTAMNEINKIKYHYVNVKCLLINITLSSCIQFLFLLLSITSHLHTLRTLRYFCESTFVWLWDTLHVCLTLDFFFSMQTLLYPKIMQCCGEFLCNSISTHFALLFTYVRVWTLWKLGSIKNVNAVGSMPLDDLDASLDFFWSLLLLFQFAFIFLEFKYFFYTIQWRKKILSILFGFFCFGYFGIDALLFVRFTFFNFFGSYSASSENPNTVRANADIT